MNHLLRTLVGCAALAVGVGHHQHRQRRHPGPPGRLVQEGRRRRPQVPPDPARRTRQEEAAGDKLLDGQIKPALGVALLLTAYADVLGDAGLKADAVKVAEAIAKKELQGGSPTTWARSWRQARQGEARRRPPKTDEAMLAAVMSPFRGGSVGGLKHRPRHQGHDQGNKSPTKIDPAAVEILAVRSAVINCVRVPHPNEKAGDQRREQEEVGEVEHRVDRPEQADRGRSGQGREADEKNSRACSPP